MVLCFVLKPMVEEEEEEAEVVVVVGGCGFHTRVCQSPAVFRAVEDMP